MLTLKKEFKAEEVFDSYFPDYDQDADEERIAYTKAYTGLDDLELEDNAFQPKTRSSRRFGR